jgi:3-oxoacyl-[acyl-carrier-protein] synthase-3
VTIVDRATPSSQPGTEPAFSPMRRVAGIASVAMVVPDRIVGNREIAETIGVDESWIVKRTGTSERPWASPGERMTEFSARAGAAALARAGVSAAEVDLVLVATSTPESFVPAAAPVVAGMLGAHRAGAMDIGSACTGFLSGLAMACGQIESGRAQHVLLIGCDFLSQFLDLTDRNTAPLFADGAGAAVITAAAGGGDGISPIVLHADSAGADWIRLDRTGYVRVQGQETFRAAVRCMSEVTLEALALAGRDLSEIDLFVYHQANSRIIRAVGERLGLPAERVVDYVARFANASTATIPIALSVAEQEGRLRPGDLVLVSAFGGGFTWGGTVLRWAPVPGVAGA